jgi:hypothetical protein
LAALSATSRDILTLLYEAGHEAGLERSAILSRSAALFFLCATGNLADDLADGDCDYFEDPRVASGAQYLLHTIAFAELAASGLSADAIGLGARTLVAAASYHQVEVRTQTWTAAHYREVGEAIAGRQWDAILSMQWHGTPLSPHASEIGRAAGFVGHVVADITSHDPRFTGMSADDQRQVLVVARDAMTILRAHPLRSVAAILAHAKVIEGDTA